MKLWLHKTELFVDRVIPLFVLLLLAIIVIELFFPGIGEHYHIWITCADTIIVIFFVIDLLFKYLRIRKIPEFLKTCWLDIIAIFPFFLLFRLIERAVIIAEVSGSFKQFQMLFHEGIEIEKETAKILEEGGKIAQEVEKTGKASRVRGIIRVFKPISKHCLFMNNQQDSTIYTTLKKMLRLLRRKQSRLGRGLKRKQSRLGRVLKRRQLRLGRRQLV